MFDNLAYKEFYRTKGLSAFNLEQVKTKKVINQHATKYTFSDDSYLVIKKNTNGMTCYTYTGIAHAERMLFY